MKYSEMIQVFIDLINEARDTYPKACDGVGEMDKLKVDLEHAFEFNTEGQEDLVGLGHEMEECLRRRREYKNTVELLGPIVDYFRDNRKAMDKMATLLKDVRKIEERQAERIYTPRVRKEARHDDERSTEAGNGEYEAGVLDGSEVE